MSRAEERRTISAGRGALRGIACWDKGYREAGLEVDFGMTNHTRSNVVIAVAITMIIVVDRMNLTIIRERPNKRTLVPMIVLDSQ